MQPALWRVIDPYSKFTETLDSARLRTNVTFTDVPMPRSCAVIWAGVPTARVPIRVMTSPDFSPALLAGEPQARGWIGRVAAGEVAAIGDGDADSAGRSAHAGRRTVRSIAADGGSFASRGGAEASAEDGELEHHGTGALGA